MKSSGTVLQTGCIFRHEEKQKYANQFPIILQQRLKMENSNNAGINSAGTRLELIICKSFIT